MEKRNVFCCTLTAFITLLAFDGKKILSIYEAALTKSIPNMIIEFIKYPLGCFFIAAVVYVIVTTITKK